MNDPIKFVDALERQLVDGIAAASRRPQHRRRGLIAATATAAAAIIGVAAWTVSHDGPDGRLSGAASTPPPTEYSTAPATAATTEGQMPSTITPITEPAPPTTVPATDDVPTVPTTSTAPPATLPCPDGDNYQYPIRRCDEGFAVLAIRSRLADLGYFGPDPVVENDWFDNELEDAVRRFQSDHGLESDGLVGPVTWRALETGVGGPDDDGNGVIDPYEIPLDVGECYDDVPTPGECPPLTVDY